MMSNIINSVIAAGITLALLRYDVSLEMSMLVGFIAGCFYTLCDISRTLRKSE